MPDRRRHRGAHPADRETFAPRWVPVLRRAAHDLAWLLGRGYGDGGALKLVGDHHGLDARQRLAVRRSTCSSEARAGRAARRVARGAPDFTSVGVDGLNCLITVEAVLSRGLVLVGLDGAHRDLASVHGSYRRVEETREASERLGRMLARLGFEDVCWYLDRPVSNSGRLAELLRSVAREASWPWQVNLVDSADRALLERGGLVATSDGPLLDRAPAWIDLPGLLVAQGDLGAWIVDLRGQDHSIPDTGAA